MSNHRYALAIVIPCYNEHFLIRSTISEVNAFFSEMSRLLNNPKEFIIVIVDDGSIDDTKDIVMDVINNINKLSSVKSPTTDKKILLIDYPDNHGKGYAIRSGLSAVEADNYLVMDCDLSAKLSNFTATYTYKSFDLVIGSRYLPESIIPKRQGFLRRIYSRCFNFLVMWMFDITYKDTQAGWKLYSRKARDLVLSKSIIDRYAFDVEHILICKQRDLSIDELAIEWSDNKPRSWHFKYIREMWNDLKKIKSNLKAGHYD